MSNEPTPLPTIPAERLPGLLAHPIIRIYDDRRAIGTVQRGGRATDVYILLQGWWCEARGFGEAEFAAHFQTQVEVLPITNPDEFRAEQERYMAFVRETGGLMSPDVAMGRQFIVATSTGEFIQGLLQYGEAAAGKIKRAIDSYNASVGADPESVIAALGVQGSGSDELGVKSEE